MFILVLLPLLSIAAGFGIVAAVIFFLLVVPLHRIIMYTIKRNGVISGPSALSGIIPRIEASITRGAIESNFQSVARSATEDDPKIVDLEIGALGTSHAFNKQPTPLESEHYGDSEQGVSAVFDV